MFIPHTKSDREAMLKVVGIERLEDLFRDIPEEYRFPELDLPPAISEMEVASEMFALASANNSNQEMISFLGAGAYNHYTPASVDEIIRRGEFLTAYTPYQPEISQGTLQAIFDYQSLIAALTGMDISNASHYDGATAVAEAISLANANFRGKRKKVILSPAVHPHYRQTARTYNPSGALELIGDEDFNELKSSPDDLIPLIDDDTAVVIVQYPDFFGRVFDLTSLAEATHAAGALLSVAVNPLSLGMLKPPGDFGADIVTGEGQSLGIPLSFGGPYLGIFATRDKLVRKMAGRLVGETIDNRGQRAYVLTLTAREQHIRRERATSNICTNQGLIALASTVYMSLLGKHGLHSIAELCYHKAHYAAKQIANLPEYKLWSEAPFFNEFVVECPRPVQEINDHLLEHGIIGGYDLGADYPAMKNHFLLATTEMNSKDEIDLLVEVLAEVSDD